MHMHCSAIIYWSKSYISASENDNNGMDFHDWVRVLVPVSACMLNQLLGKEGAQN